MQIEKSQDGKAVRINRGHWVYLDQAGYDLSAALFEDQEMEGLRHFCYDTPLGKLLGLSFMIDNKPTQYSPDEIKLLKLNGY